MKIEPQEWEETVTWLSSLARWNTFLTMTYRWEGSEDSARRCYDRFRKVKVAKFPSIFCTERNPSRDGYHVHGMLALNQWIRRSDLWKDWFEKKGRCRIEPARSVQSVQGYCLKYLFKSDGYWQIDNCIRSNETNFFKDTAFRGY
jgi:hypothetical protein